MKQPGKKLKEKPEKKKKLQLLFRKRLENTMQYKI